MKRFIKYNDISDFARAVKNLKWQVQYQGCDSKGSPIMDRNAIMPKSEVTFTEKIHGTNAAVCYSNPDGFWVQSRERILPIEKDNYGCCQAAMNNKAAWISIITQLAEYHNIDLDNNIISVYYEWCGGSIQKKAAVSGLDKRSIIFDHFKVSPLESQVDKHGDNVPTDQQPAIWLETIVGEVPLPPHALDSIPIMIRASDANANIFNIYDYNVWKFAVDFDNAKLHVNDFIELLHSIELNSPVGKAMGIEDNIAEGIVGTFKYDNIIYKFKVKGDAHTTSKVKKLKEVDNVKEQAKIDLAIKCVTPGRCEQGWALANKLGEDGEPDKKNLGEFLSWMHRDIIKECQDDYKEAGLEFKEVNGKVSEIAKRWFFSELAKIEF